MPDASPEYQREPRPESIQTFLKYVRAKSVVSAVVLVNDLPGLTYDVQRPTLGNLRIFLTNIYIVGEADVYDITSSTDGLNAIVTLSAWNSYTREAKELAKEHNIGLFRFGEFMGAVFHAGQKFIDYVPPAR